MSSIVFFGECMIELFENSDGSLKQSFAGDILNSAIYLKRTFPKLEVNFASAVGRDSYSNKMVQLFSQEQIGTQFVYRSETKIPGLYSIQTDDKGERSFTYWRSDSAAKQIMNFIYSAEIAKFSRQEMFFFSGISLAVIPSEDRDQFWNLVRLVKNAGVKIIFDPNYRARLWSSPQEAKQAIETALEFANVCLPGVEDFRQLYGHSNALDVVEFCEPFELEELIIKNGEQGIFCVINGEPFQFDVEPITKVVDTTSAGDSFNGVYLGARLNGLNPSYAVELASRAAAEVITHQGAIVAAKDFQRFVEKLEITPVAQANNA